ncbi:sulfotransferase [Microbacter sp. GSS18]|nr:sulfotransferase [Microbacter sp. GSS18]
MQPPQHEGDPRWPNLFILGAPRSGTTSLHTWLQDMRHPDVFMSAVKEPHFFSGFDLPDLERAILQTTTEPDDYLALFTDGARARWRGEASSYYLADPDVAPRIAARAPEAKLIAILRDPVDRAFSHYLLYGRRGAQKSFAATIDDIRSDDVPTNPAYDFIEHGMYAEQLSAYLRHFRRDQILVLYFDELREPTAVLRKVLDFLGADRAPLEGYEPATAQNAYSKPRNRLAAAVLSNDALARAGLRFVPRPLVRRIRGGLLSEGDKPRIDLQTRAELEAVFSPGLAALEELLGEDVSRLR